MIYFLYKLNKITGIGGITPSGYKNVDLGLGSCRDWYLGKTEDPNYLDLIREFNPIVINDIDVVNGLQFMDKTKITSSPLDGIDKISSSRDLTEEEKLLKSKAEYFLDKLKSRGEIESQVGDDRDLIADLSKRIDILESVLFKLIKCLVSNLDIKYFTEIEEELNLVNKYLLSLSNKTLKNSITTNELSTLYDKVTERNSTITDIVSISKENLVVKEEIIK